MAVGLSAWLVFLLLGDCSFDVLRYDKSFLLYLRHCLLDVSRFCVYIFFGSRHNKDFSLFDLINIIAKSDRGALVAVHQPSCVDAVFLLTFASP